MYYCKVFNKNGNEIKLRTYVYTTHTHTPTPNSVKTLYLNTHVGTAYGNPRRCVITRVFRFKLLLILRYNNMLMPRRESRRRKSIVFTRREENQNTSTIRRELSDWNSNKRTRENCYCKHIVYKYSSVPKPVCTRVGRATTRLRIIKWVCVYLIKFSSLCRRLVLISFRTQRVSDFDWTI